MSTIVTTLKVGDRIRVIDLMTDRAHRGTVAALWTDKKAISVDVKKGTRVYFRGQCMDRWYLPDLTEQHLIG